MDVPSFAASRPSHFAHSSSRMMAGKGFGETDRGQCRASVIFRYRRITSITPYYGLKSKRCRAFDC
jgi:hypothetical protein